MNSRKILKINPPANIGIVGGGQLGRMMSLEAKKMGYGVIVLDPKPNSPAGQVSDEQIVAEFSDVVALRELAEKTDVMTYEFEHIDADVLGVLEKEGYSIYPSADTLRKINNKYLQKSMLRNSGISVPDLYSIDSLAGLKEVFSKLGGKIVLKTCSGGYDGKGSVAITDIDKLEETYEQLCNHELMAEEFVEYVKEVSIIIAKNHEGISLYPIAENVHRDSILINSIIPADITEKAEGEIRRVAEKVAELIDDFGVFCIEMFIDSDSNVLVNEIAPRPHNSGHYTIEGCITSQFEQIIRIIAGMPLGSTRLISPCSMYNILGSDDVEGAYCVEGVDLVLNIEDCHLHLYGKSETKHLKKIGHITAKDCSVEGAAFKAKRALNSIKITRRSI